LSEINIRYIKIKELYLQVYGLVYVTLSDFIIIKLFKFSEFL